MRFSSPSCGELDGDSAAAEVDHRDEGGWGVVAVAAVVDESGFGVEAFEFGVGQAEVDSGQDAGAVFAQGLGELDDRGDAAAAGSGQPAVEVGVGASAWWEP